MCGSRWTRRELVGQDLEHLPQPSEEKLAEVARRISESDARSPAEFGKRRVVAWGRFSASPCYSPCDVVERWTRMHAKELLESQTHKVHSFICKDLLDNDPLEELD